MSGLFDLPSDCANYHYEIDSNNSEIEISVEDFMPLGTDKLFASFVVYGVNEYNKLDWYKFNSTSLAIPFNKLLFRGYERIFVDFYRHEVQTDIKLNFLRKPVNGNLETSF